MEYEQTQDGNAEVIPSDENEILKDLEDLKNDEIQTLPIAPFAVPIYNWSDLKDSVNWAETLIGMNTALKNHMVKYNRLIDTVAQLTRDWNSDISQLQVSLTGTHSIAKDANTRSLNHSTTLTEHRKWIDKLWDWESDGRSKVATLWNWSYKVDEKNTAQDTSIGAVRAQASAWNTDRYSNIQGIWAVNAAQEIGIASALSNAQTWNKERYADIQKIWGVNKDQDTAISNVLANATQWNKDRAAETSNIFTAVGELRTANTSRTNEIKALRTDASQWNTDRYADIKTIWSVNDNQDKSIKARADETGNLFTAVGDLKKKDNSLDDRLKKIEGFDFGGLIDLTVLVTAINAVGTKVQKLVDLFNVDKVLPGTFTFFLQAHIKTQTDAITQALAMVDESLNDNFINYFDDSKNGKFWTAFKKFSDFQMAVFFGVFFETLDEKWEENWLDILETWNITNDLLLLSNQWLDLINSQLSTANNTLAIITQWLKQIYEKPLGDINNEAGTNLWDFLSSIVDNLGDIITTQLKEFVKVLREILDFLDKLIDKLIGLLVPENVDFMRTGFDDISLKFNLKFDSFLSIATDVTNMFKPIPKSVIDELSFDLMGVPFVPKLSLLDSFVPQFRNVMALMLWFRTGWWAFRRFTGTGDVVNDS